MSHLLSLAASALSVAIAALLGSEYRVPDAALLATMSLPDGATTSTSSGIDMGSQSKSANLPGDFELVLTAPALNTSQLPDSQTITYAVVTGGNADLTAPTVIMPGVLVQTGAGGVGAAAASITMRVPAEIQQFIGIQAVKSGSGDASAATATLQANF